MAECVSCGKEIPAGKFFCDDCYAKMKGRRGPTGKVPAASTPANPQQAVAHGDEAGTTGADVDTVVPAGVIPARKASGTLTPPSSKQVVSMRPPADKATKEKGGKKRFTVTITFSERTYAALARINPRRRKENGALQNGAGEPQAARSRSRSSTRGRPRLQAVGASSRPAKRKSGFMGMIAYRDRAADSGDIAAVTMALVAVLAILLMSFQPWARITLEDPEALQALVIEVKGIDLGAITYVCMALAAAALLYTAAAWVFKGAFTLVDFGVVLLVAGVLFIPLFYTAISSNTRMLQAALEQLGRSGGSIPSQFDRQTLWPAYIMVIAGALLALAGLVRLSERKGGKIKETQAKKGEGPFA